MCQFQQFGNYQQINLFKYYTEIQKSNRNKYLPRISSCPIKMQHKQTPFFHCSQPPHTPPIIFPLSPPSSALSNSPIDNTPFSSSLQLKLKQFTIQFYSSYKLTLNIPEQTTVYELTEIIRNYNILHSIHGRKDDILENCQKKQNKIVGYQPWILSSVDGKLLDDLYLIDGVHCLDRQIGLLSTQGLKIQYKAVQPQHRKNKNKQDNGYLAQKYQFIWQTLSEQSQSHHQSQFEPQQFPLHSLLDKYKIYLARSTKTCALHTIHAIPKHSLTFHKIQQIYSTISYYQKWSSLSHQQPTSYPSSSHSSSSSLSPSSYFPQIFETFETQQNLCIVTQCLPFNLNCIKINNSVLMDIVIGQLAKILHIMDRDHITIGSCNNHREGRLCQQRRQKQNSRGCFYRREIQLSDFSMDFNFNVKYTGIMLSVGNKQIKNKRQYKKQQIKIQQEGHSEHQPLQQQHQDQSEQKSCCSSKHQNFTQSMQKLFEKLLQNCSIKIIQLYLPLLHWFKNKRITNYVDFLKYTQLPLMKQSSSINIDSQSKYKYKYQNVLKNLMENYHGTGITRICEKQLAELLGEYHACTKLFIYPHFYQSSPLKLSKINNPQKQYNTSRGKIDELIENKSTVKKKKKLSICCIEVQKPLFQARYLIKRKNKSKNKTKYLLDVRQDKKIKSKSMIESKVNKTKKHTRRISEFLIDD